MAIGATLLQAVAKLMFERPIRGMSNDQLITMLDQSRMPFAQHIQKHADTQANRVLLAHIIGIECWAQARLRQLTTGQNILIDESDSYTPSTDTPYAMLVAHAGATRIESSACLQELLRAGVPLTRTIVHNQFSELSVAAWIQYIVKHSMLEARKMR